jgi:hypothetical protein
MPRPESVDDLEMETVTIATVHLDAISTDPVLLKGYTDMLTAMTKGGAEVEHRYQQVTFSRTKNPAEALDQLRSAQAAWDNSQELYERWARGEEFQYEYMLSSAKRHAQKEGLPMFPWEIEGRSEASLDEVLDRIGAEVDA